MSWTVYTRLMRPILQDHEPRQPKREERRFLRHAPKPPLPVLEGTDAFAIEELPLITTVPRNEIPDLNFTVLQYWLDHLGPAIYNPISAYKDDGGNLHIGRDGSHRTRCLWEIGEPSVRILIRNTPKPTRGRRDAKYLEAPAIPHFRVNPAYTWRQYYPCIYPPSPTLLRFYEEKKDGVYYRDTLDTPLSFTEILGQNKNLSYRFDILNEILKFDVAGKSLLDLGCYFGHYMFLLLEHGASHAVGVDNNRFRVGVANHLAVRRGVNRGPKSFKAIHGDINEYVENNERPVDIVLLLNVFHHLLYHDEERAWNTLNTALNRCDRLFLMTQNIKGVYDEWGGDIEKAVEEKTGAVLTPLLKTRYRKRLLYRLEK